MERETRHQGEHILTKFVSFVEACETYERKVHLFLSKIQFSSNFCLDISEFSMGSEGSIRKEKENLFSTI